jgi:hypothetical protein
MKKNKNFAKYLQKGWGHEKEIVNYDKYCGKLLFFNEGKKCSFHYHKLKTETFLVNYGKIFFMSAKLEDYSNNSEMQEIIQKQFKENKFNKYCQEMTKGCIVHLDPFLIHCVYAVEPSEIIEFSTQHFDSDSIRLLKGD